jgi:cell division protein FtsB
MRRRRLQHLLYLAIFCGFGWVLLFGDYGAHKIISAHRLEATTRQEIVELQVEKELLLARCERLRNDHFLIETLAREKLGMVRAGEQCYRLVN